jgi:hypothetical protein
MIRDIAATRLGNIHQQGGNGPAAQPARAYQ